MVEYSTGSIHIQPVEDSRMWLLDGNISSIPIPKLGEEVLRELRCSGNTGKPSCDGHQLLMNPQIDCLRLLKFAISQ